MGEMPAGEDPSDLQVESAGTPTKLEVELDSSKAIAKIQAITAVIEGCTKASLQRTNPQDWVKQVAPGRDGDAPKVSYYLQATGAQKIRPIFGIYYRDRKATEIRYADGSYAFLCEGIIGSKVLDQLYGEITIEIEGGRSSKDGFFAGRDGKRDVDPLDVRKASIANWETRAVTALLGLKNVTAEDLRRNGIDVDKIAGVEFKQGAEGGGQVNLISDKQRGRLFAISKTANVPEGAVKALLAAYGFDSSTSITRDRYEDICSTVEGGTDKVQKKTQELLKAKPAAPAQPAATEPPEPGSNG